MTLKSFGAKLLNPKLGHCYTLCTNLPFKIMLSVWFCQMLNRNIKSLLPPPYQMSTVGPQASRVGMVINSGQGADNNSFTCQIPHNILKQYCHKLDLINNYVTNLIVRIVLDRSNFT